jgi:uncharacterized membrane protein
MRNLITTSVLKRNLIVAKVLLVLLSIGAINTVYLYFQTENSSMIVVFAFFIICAFIFVQGIFSTRKELRIRKNRTPRY